ncbi:hypothetical protein KDA_37650 [Dictyobacter alpinus]|uniref:Haloacid dehalogenase n=1 Tax=Dictyobacter alpinus TaxID=2014873 RepID=A0A402BA72_9CHLR|nr:HAD family hydrolase [Dictyobacter alpinus]GCE28281.1 hypothetical protein KDA_37650 [Dictyobacter alpinus]
MISENKLSTLTGRTFSCLLFDLGNTLWQRDIPRLTELEQATIQQAAQIARRFSASTPLAQYDDVNLGTELREEMLQQFHLAIAQRPGFEPTGAAMVEQAFLALSFSQGDNKVFEDIFEALRVPIFQSRELFPDVIATLKELQRRSFQLGVVTNRYWGGEPFQKDLQIMGMTNYFEPHQTIVSADEHIRKPNPQIFALALTACQADPRETIMIGDSLIADVAGAQQLAIFSVWKPSRYQEVSQYLADTEGMTVNEYNHRQLALLKEHATIEPPTIPTEHWKDPYLQHFASGLIRPQLIINNVSELLAWL